MREGRCIIIGAGDLTVGRLDRREGDFLIAVDGGLSYCGILEAEPDLLIGDFDSVSEKEARAVETLERDFPEKVIRLKPEKNDTDMLFALKHGLEQGFREFLIYGGTGGRLEHTFANIQCLLYLKKQGAVGYLMDGNGMILVLKDEAVRFRADLEGYLSLFSLGERAEGVTIRGMKYPLEDYAMTNDYPIGISNEFIGQEAEISVKSGELVCIVSYFA